jgi:hypothetical protein
VNNTEKQRIIGGLRWIGLFSNDLVVPCGNPLDTLCSRLEGKMQYGPGERDMVMLQHKFEIEHKDGTKVERAWYQHRFTIANYTRKQGPLHLLSMAIQRGIPLWHD